MTLDRIDNAKGYSQGNCRWTDDVTQNRNSRAAKITEADAKAIRKSTASRKALAARYGLSEVMISYIKNHKNWRNLV